jgi:hypothetical protein
MDFPPCPTMVTRNRLLIIVAAPSKAQELDVTWNKMRSITRVQMIEEYIMSVGAEDESFDIPIVRRNS